MSGDVVHACPAKGEGRMPCCGRTPFEVPRSHRMTLDPSLVTCSSSSAVSVGVRVEGTTP